jgi:hypothetical protein
LQDKTTKGQISERWLRCAELSQKLSQAAGARPTKQVATSLLRLDSSLFQSSRSELFRRRDLFDWSSFDVRPIALFIGVVQELVDDTSALLLLDPSFLRFLFGEELVVHFPAH